MVTTKGGKKVGLSVPSTTVTMPEEGSWSRKKKVYVVGLSIFGRRNLRKDFKSGRHRRTLCIYLRRTR